MEQETHISGLKNQLSIFPPINHEDLPIPPHAPPSQPPPPTHASLSLDSDDHPSPPPQNNHSSNNNSTKNYNQFMKLFDFALHFWNSKLASLISSGVFASFRNVAVTASFVGFVWYLFRWRWRRRKCLGGRGGESVEHLKSLVKSKDEKILQLLEQIAHMNKVLLDRYKIPALKGS